jgi:hypothetical protein
LDATWAAVVTGAFGLLMLLIEKGRRENNRDHGFVRDRLDAIKEDIADLDTDISVIEAKIDTHILDHSVGAVEQHDAPERKKPSKKK